MSYGFDEKWLAEYQAKQGRKPEAVKTPLPSKPHERGTRHGKSPGPNKTEAAYGRVLALEFPGAKIRYEALTLQLEAGHAYRPDWVVTLATGEIVCVEVKNGAYRHASYGRSRLAYDQAAIEWPCFKFRWAELKNGTWEVR